jgi:hypothetical protein
MNDPSRGIMIQTILHLYGATQPNPVAFRRWLETLPSEPYPKGTPRAPFKASGAGAFPRVSNTAPPSVKVAHIES